jgi:ABC-type phosphate transport system permease subunit
VRRAAGFGLYVMIRFLLRSIGLLLLALGFIFLVYDGIRSISDGTILLTRTSEVWNATHDRSLAAFQTLVERNVSTAIWQAVIAPILAQPAAAVACILGVILTVLGRKKRPLIGYARD